MKWRHLIQANIFQIILEVKVDSIRSEERRVGKEC